MRTIKFCSVVFGVKSRLSIVNKIHWRTARRRLLLAKDGRRIRSITYTPPSKCWWHATVQQWSMPKPDIGLKSRFLPTQPALDASVRKFGVEKLEWCGYPTVKKLKNMFIRFDRIHESSRGTDWRTDTARRHRPRLCIGSRSKHQMNKKTLSRSLKTVSKILWTTIPGKVPDDRCSAEVATAG